MIEKHDDFSGNIIHFVASGMVTSEDYEKVLIPEVEKMLESHSKLRMIYQLDETFESFTAGAMWDDTQLGLNHFTAWEKIAVVTDVVWIRGALNVFAFAIPTMVKIYSNADLEEAKEWIQE